MKMHYHVFNLFLPKKSGNQFNNYEIDCNTRNAPQNHQLRVLRLTIHRDLSIPN